MEDLKKCNKCRRKLPRTKEYFGTDKRNPDGFFGYCRECGRKPKGFFYISGMKRCKECDEYLPATLEYFEENKNTNDNLSGTCIKCRKDIKDNFKLSPYKICSSCNRELPNTIEYFYHSKRGLDGFHYSCKDCQKEYAINSKEKIVARRKEYHIKNRERLLAKCRERNSTVESKIKRKRYVLKLQFGIDEDTVVNAMNIQKGCCDICKKSLVDGEGVKTYHVDHNHTTGDFRGLLCSKCNTAIGLLEEDKEILKSAIRYLEKHNE